MAYSLPFFGEDGTLLGVLMLSYDLDKYSALLLQISLPRDSDVVLLDRNGICVTAPKSGRASLAVGMGMPRENWLKITDNPVDEGSFKAVRDDGTEVIFAFRKLRLAPGDPPHVVVLADSPVASVLAAANRALWTNLALLVFAAALAPGIARMLGRAIVGRQVEVLRLSEIRYRSLVEDQTEVVCRFLPDGTYTFVNEAFCRFLGKSREALVGSRWFPAASIPDVLMIRQKLDRLKPDEPVVTFETRFRNGGNALRWMQFSCRGLFGHDGELLEIQSVGRDITERVQAENALKESEERYRLLFEQAPLGIIHYDITGAIRDINDHFTEIIGSPKERILKLNMLEDLTNQDLIEAIMLSLQGSVGVFEGDYASVTGNKTSAVRVLFKGMHAPDGQFSGGSRISPGEVYRHFSRTRRIRRTVGARPQHPPVVLHQRPL